MNTNLLTQTNGLLERPWWSVRTSLIATLIVATGTLVAMFAPTPLQAWVFGADKPVYYTASH